MNSSGIYEISNAINGRKYIGSAVNFAARWRVHKHRLAKGEHHNTPLQNAWNKHGAEAFEFKVLIVCAPEELTFFEQRAMEVLRPTYNVCRVAGRTTGYKHTPETKARFHLRKKATRTPESYKAAAAKAAKTMKMTPEHKEAVRRAHTGKVVAEETKVKIKAALKGRVNTPEQIAKWKASREANKLGS